MTGTTCSRCAVAIDEDPLNDVFTVTVRGQRIVLRLDDARQLRDDLHKMVGVTGSNYVRMWTPPMYGEDRL